RSFRTIPTRRISPISEAISDHAACCTGLATDIDDPTEDARFGRVGKQKIEDTGPLMRKRMETIDDDIAASGADIIGRQVKAGRPFFVWINFTYALRTHPKPESIGQAGRWHQQYDRFSTAPITAHT